MSTAVTLNEQSLFTVTLQYVNMSSLCFHTLLHSMLCYLDLSRLSEFHEGHLPLGL